MEQANKGKIEGFMTDLGRKLDQLLDRARQGAEEAKLSERMDDLRQATDKLEHELHEFVKDDEKWREVQVHLKGAALELRKAFESTFRKQATDTDEPFSTAGGQQHAAGNTYNTTNTSSAGTSSGQEATQNHMPGSDAAPKNDFEGRNI